MNDLQLTIHLIHTSDMDDLHWSLTILSRCIQYKNLTGASNHVGLSQPQLSRHIHKIESELGLNLLDRSAKRKTSWTPEAYRLAEVYQQSERRLKSSILELQKSNLPTSLVIGSLEGLIPFAKELCYQLYSNTEVHFIQLDIMDQNDLEKKFINGDIDLAFTSRFPSKQKLKNVLELGYQSLYEVKNSSSINVFSNYEYGARTPLKKRQSKKVFISNSLAVRKSWLERYGGTGFLPSEVSHRRKKNDLPVMIIAGELFSPQLWGLIEKFSASLKNHEQAMTRSSQMRPNSL